MPERSSKHARHSHAGPDMKRVWLRRVCLLVVAVMCVGAATAAAFSARPLRQGAVAGMSSLTPARAVGDQRAGEAGQQFTGLAARVLSRPSAVRATDGRFHIAYELVLTNMTKFAVNVERVDVRDARTHRVLQSLSGRALSSRMNPVGDAPGSQAGRPDADRPLPVRRSSGSTFACEARRTSPACSSISWWARPAPQRAGNRSGFRAWSVGSRFDLGHRWCWVRPCAAAFGWRRRGAVTSTPTIAAACSPWTATWSCSQRFAIDWIMLDRQHRGWVGNPARLSSYFSYGQPEIAVGRWNGRDRARRHCEHTAAARSNAAAPRAASRQLRGAARQPGGLRDLCAHETRLRPCPRLASTFAVASCWESWVTAAIPPPHTSIYRSRSPRVSSATACPSSSIASISSARSPNRYRTPTSA